MAYWERFAPYVSVAEKAAKAAKKLKQLQKKNPGLRPVILPGSTIARSWWGKSWCRNLERYADFSNRIGRGRSYVRHGAVLDLQIQPGRIDALVQGSRSTPYNVSIRIDKLDKPAWRAIRTACEGRIDSLQVLLSGRFPEDLAAVFMTQEKGLFPSPRQIHFECSCPDWAGMCKHVAAVLYGVGARLDEDPAMLFVLRAAAVDDLIHRAVAETTRKLLEQAQAESDNGQVLADADLSKLFGIDMEEEVQAAPPAETKSDRKKGISRRANTQGKRKTAPDMPNRKPAIPDSKKTRSIKAKPSIPKSKTTHPGALQKGTQTQPPQRSKAPQPPDATAVLKIIRRSRKGVTVPDLQQQTGLDAAAVRAIVYAALREGTIQRISRGVFKRS
jgi:uncharacterized Zn finger protein